MDYTYLRPKRVHEALAGHPDRPSLRTVTRWCEGHPVPAWADALVRSAMGVGTNESPPPWAEAVIAELGHKEAAPRLAERLDEIERKIDAVRANQERVADGASAAIIEALAPPERMARAVELIERLEALLPLLGGASPEGTGSADRVEESPPGQ